MEYHMNRCGLNNVCVSSSRIVNPLEYLPFIVRILSLIVSIVV
jgi:hypothetical protein